MQNNQFRRIDTKRADGVYVRFEHVEEPDETCDPREYLFQEPAYKSEDEERLASWRRGEWNYIGIRALACITVIRNGRGTLYELTSAGLWGIESDSGDDYFAELYAEQRDELLADLQEFGNIIVEN